MTNTDKLKEAIGIIGNQRQLSQRLDVSRAVVSRWVNGEQDLPIKRAYQISKLTNHQITVFDLRPDLDAEL